MVELTLPDCEARVSPELLALLREGSWKVSATDTVPAEPSDPVGAAYMPAEDPPPRAVPAPSWPVVSLRQDGARPMRFPGLMVTSHSQSLDVNVNGSPVTVARHLALYVTESGDAVVHVACIPAEDQPARPVHRAARLTNADEFDALLRATSPDTCFAVSRVSAQWKGHVQDPEGPFHPSRSVQHPDNTE